MTSDHHDSPAGHDRSSLSSLKEQAGEKVSQVADTLKQEASRREEGIRGSLSRQADQLASALRSAKSEVDPQSGIGTIFDYAADSVGGLAQNLKGADTAEMIDGVRSFARERPGAFLGLCALGGFAAARFLVASAPSGSQRGHGSHGGSGRPGSFGLHGTDSRMASGSQGQGGSMSGSSRLGAAQGGIGQGGAGGFDTASRPAPSGTSSGATMETRPSGTSSGAMTGSGAGGDLAGAPLGGNTDRSAGTQSPGYRNAPGQGETGGRND